MSQEKVGLGPSNFRSGDGFLDDKTVVFSNVHFRDDFKYTGKDDMVELLVLSVDMTPDDGETTYTQQFSLGKTANENFGVAKDKHSLFLKVDGKSISENSKYGKLATSLVNAGFPESDIDDGVHNLNGLKAHMGRTVVKMKIEGEMKDVDYLLVEKVFMDGERASAGVGVSASANGKATEEQIETARDMLGEALDRKPQLTMDEAFKRVNRLALKNKSLSGSERDAITELIQNEDFLQSGADDKEWGFNGDTISAV